MPTFDELLNTKISEIVATLIPSAVATAVEEAIADLPPGAGGGADGPGWFPPIGSSYSTFLEARERQKTRFKALPKASDSLDIEPPFVAGGANSTSYSDVHRLPNGSNIYVPFSRSTPYIRSPNGSFSTTTYIPDVTNFGVSGGVTLWKSGRILFVPYCMTRCLAYNYYTANYDVLKSGLGSLQYKWNGGATDRNGIAYLTPHMDKRIVVFNESLPAESQWWFSPTIAMADMGYAGPPILLPDGKLLFVPYMEARVMMFDPATGSVTFGPAVFPGEEAYVGGRLLNSTTVLFYPHKAGKPSVYNFQSGTRTDLNVNIGRVGVAEFNGGVGLPRGTDILVPFQSNFIYEIDAENGTARKLNGGSGSQGAYKNGCLLDNGDVAFAPFNAYYPGLLRTSQNIRIDPEFIYSPFS